jgi:RimJ/RimL family protein N-acetyltransferase
MTENWIKYPARFVGDTIDLFSLEKSHFDQLFESAKDKRIWEFYPIDCSDRNKFVAHYTELLAAREKGNHYPFVILDKKTNRFIGSTSLYDIHSKDRNLEIGWTWLHPDYWATDVNFESKLLLLSYCFDKLKCVRVQFRTNDQNLRSQKAIQKIGGKFEGILRKNKIRDDGSIRSSVYYSIVDDEWENVRQKLLFGLAQKRNNQLIRPEEA